MDFIKKNLSGILVCFIIAVPAWLLGKAFPVIGGPVIAILAGMLITLMWTDKGKAESGIKWTSKIILQTAVVLLRIRNEPRCNPADRETITANYYLYNQYFPNHRMAAPQDYQCSCLTLRFWLVLVLPSVEVLLSQLLLRLLTPTIRKLLRQFL